MKLKAIPGSRSNRPARVTLEDFTTVANVYGPEKNQWADRVMKRQQLLRVYFAGMRDARNWPVAWIIAGLRAEIRRREKAAR